MPVYLLFGRLGAGKGIMAGQRILDYMSQGRRVVCNFPVSVEHLKGFQHRNKAQAVVEVIPDRPTAELLWQLGQGGPNEERAGVLVLDECSAFLNARSWQGKEREALLDWFIHARKLRWDVILVTQHPSQLDKQVREAICELYTSVRRMDRLKVPVINIRLPRVHIAIAKYGSSPNDPVCERWFSRGGPDVWNLYDTKWISQENCDSGWHSIIPAGHSIYFPITGTPLECHQQRVKRIKRLAVARSARAALAAAGRAGA